jgi:alkylation response protein AidB-like acyl-CoA dehydrogenase
MYTNYTKEQEMLRKSARDFLKAECPKETVRELEEDKKGYSPDTWKKMAELEWTGLIIPEEYDGLGMNLQDLTIIMEEIGRNIFPAPFLPTVVASFLILEAGSEEQKKEFLPKIARGELIAAPAFLEESGMFRSSDIAAAAKPDGDNYIISGTKLFAEMAHAADYIICAARTGEEEPSGEGISLFMVDASSPGVECEVIPSIAMDKQCEVRFKNTPVPASHLLGEAGRGWPAVESALKKAAVAKCAESIGAIQACVDMTVQYSKDRVQYNRPIGAFQAVQHKLADMWISMQTSRYLVYQVAWKASEGLPCDKEISMAKAYVNEAYKFVSKWAVRLHGGMGTSREHDISLYYRRAKAADYAFGSTDFHKRRVAEGINLK